MCFALESQKHHRAASLAAHVYTGQHLSELNISMEPVPKTGNTGGFVRNNERPRYHYLEFPVNVPIVSSVIDFKYYFSVNSEYLRARKRTSFAYRVSVSELFARTSRSDLRRIYLESGSRILPLP